MEIDMALANLMPWSRGGRNLSARGGGSDPFLALHREMNRLFDDFVQGFDPGISAFGGNATGWPNIDVTETDKAVRVTAELPGLDRKEVELTLSDNILTLRGEKHGETEDKNRHIGECFYGRFERRIPLGLEVDRNRVEASFKNGILMVTLPKTATSESHTKTIAIN
jgi:HSP20 family protein